jgi:hypothetical protein
VTSRLARRIATLGLLCSTTVGAVMFLAPSPVSAQAPDVAAWWNAANLGDPAPAPPAPPDVTSGDLFVQGSNSLPVPSPLGAAPATTQAVSGVSFDLPAGALVGALTLQIDGTPPPQVSVVACRATETFTSTDNGPWSEVPPYDGNSCVPAKLKGSDVVFTDVAKLVLRDRLAVIILPGPVDRVVFKKPNAKALTVSDSGGIGAAAPPLGAGTGSTTVTGGKGSSGTASVGGSQVAGPPTAGLPGAGMTNTSTGANTPPVVAGSGTGSPVASPPTTPVASTSGLSNRSRRIIALVVIAAEVLGYALLMRNRAPAAVPAAAAATVAGGKLRAPDRWTGPRTAVSGGAGGVGRFRRERVGPTPHL